MAGVDESDAPALGHSIASCRAYQGGTVTLAPRIQSSRVRPREPSRRENPRGTMGGQARIGSTAANILDAIDTLKQAEETGAV